MLDEYEPVTLHPSPPNANYFPQSSTILSGRAGLQRSADRELPAPGLLGRSAPLLSTEVNLGLAVFEALSINQFGQVQMETDDEKCDGHPELGGQSRVVMHVVDLEGFC